jgi:DNA-binding transcriptional regulator YiaG
VFFEELQDARATTCNSEAEAVAMDSQMGRTVIYGAEPMDDTGLDVEPSFVIYCRCVSHLHNAILAKNPVESTGKRKIFPVISPEKPLLEQQAAEITKLISESGLTSQQFAKRLMVAPDSLRKYSKGYIRASDRLMQSIRKVSAELQGGLYSHQAKPPQMISAQDSGAAGYFDETAQILRVLLKAQSPSQLAQMTQAILEDNEITPLARKRAVAIITEHIRNRVETEV